MRCLVVGLAVAAEAAVAQVIGEDEDDVGFWLRRLGSIHRG
ncbi:MAG: hypothetical protein ACK55I_30900 [bacterium]